MSVSLATFGDAAFEASEPTQSASEFNDNYVPQSNLQDSDLKIAQDDIVGLQRYGKGASLQRASLLLFSIAAVLVVSFLVFQCFRALSSRQNGGLATRRLAEGGPSGGKDNTPCQVSSGKCTGLGTSSIYRCLVSRRLCRARWPTSNGIIETNNTPTVELYLLYY